jgi:EF hand
MPSLWQKVLNSLSWNKRSQENRRVQNRRRLKMESLENRALMAVDLAVISGTAFDDLTNNGLTGDDTTISGATVQLYRDNGDNTFNAGTDTLLGTATTNTSGVYRFASTNAGGTLAAGTLSADDYFVRQLAFGTFTPPAAQLVTVTATNVAGTTVQTVDTYSTTAQALQATSTVGSTTAFNGVVATEAIGGQRDIFIEHTGGTGNLNIDVDLGNSNLLTFASGTGVVGTALIQYDGADSNVALVATGLGGLNMSAGDTLAGILVSTRGDTAGATAEVRIYTDATNFSTTTINIPDQAALEDVFVPFSAFTTGVGAAGPATFTSGGAIEVFVDGVAELDAVISVVRSLRPSVVNADLENDTSSIQVIKSTNGQDANTTTGPLLAVGSTATFTYAVTSTGGTSLQNVVLSDDNGTPGNIADDLTVTRTGGDTNANNILEVDETWTYSATRVVTSGQYTNTATVAAADLSGNNVTDTDPSNHFGVDAMINVVKSTNGQDANTTTGPVVAVGSTATFTYAVTNPGNVSLGTVVVRDDNGTTATSDDFNATFLNGDTNTNNLLDVGETWNYQATRLVTPGQYTNIGTATGNPVNAQGADIAGITDATDTDPSNHFGATAGINVVKSVNGQDANTTTGPTLGIGTTATFSYVVTNTGNVALGTVTVRDDNGTAANLADDFNATFQNGDTNSNNRLDTTETWTYNATRTVIAGQYSNTATATGTPLDATGTAITALPAPTDTDLANYFGVTGSINLVKQVNGQDANTTTGPNLLVGSTATFTYIVTNTGGTALATVVVRDDNGTVGNTADDFNATLQSGDTNSNGRMETTETWTYQATRTVVTGQYSNIGTVTANPVDVTGTDIAGLADASDTDPANYFGITTGINLVKSTNGQDANTAPGPALTVGSTATFTYVLTNTGSVPLATVVVRDDNGTTANTADDLTPTLQSGDTNSNGRLDLTETWTYQATRVVTAGAYSNIGSVTANPVDTNGADIAGIADVADTDSSNSFGATAGINVVKSTNGEDANTGTGPNLRVGATATFTYVVTNTGNTALSTVSVRDDNGTTAITTDDFNATFVSGDTDGDGRLDVTETWTYQATRIVTRGLYSNIATATGNPVDATGAEIAALADPTDTDPSTHTGIEPLSKRRFLASST